MVLTSEACFALVVVSLHTGTVTGVGVGCMVT